MEDEQEEMILTNTDGTEYIFRLRLDENSIHFYLKENNVYAPFTFEKSFTFDDFCKIHKAFKACDDLNEIYEHLKRLYRNKKLIILEYSTKKELMIHCSIGYISIEEVEQNDIDDFTLTRKMTEEKDRDLLELYKIQKEQIGKLNKIQKLIEDTNNKEYPLHKEILKIIKESQS